MITKEKRQQYRLNFIKKLGEEAYRLYLEKHSRNYRIKNCKKIAEQNRKWREKNPNYNKDYYRNKQK